MTNNTLRLSGLCLSLSLFAGTPAQAQDDAKSSSITAKLGEAMAQQCAPCHGTNGQAMTEAMPPLAGLPVETFERAMLAYRDGSRDAVIMDRVARGFTDEEIHAMAIWFEKQPYKAWQNTELEEAYKASEAAKNAMGGQQ
ncbi:c-type cytochrome [Hydrogenovibrio halophilus]|uniref:c-type cytochrome n=1 Tax=Hydrogenovibrio halophilus TaxID=373391 RepID=UPI000380C017|nr:c-type cytochrome [Hydrogenovibrio halophilus]